MVNAMEYEEDGFITVYNVRNVCGKPCQHVRNILLDAAILCNHSKCFVHCRHSERGYQVNFACFIQSVHKIQEHQLVAVRTSYFNLLKSCLMRLLAVCSTWFIHLTSNS